ncbi:uncharacterized protein MONOS_18475 [Monocercomonoides exilis]|uniref:uncharacterized protein n=1 Tax=Monocercomonoides exilis TaxID=2049356 RepID=UPI00355A2DF7|nr:hypothetical protein MONOS_18475 [Monocercomonoides exilis]
MSEDDGADEEEERWVADLPNSSQSARKVKAPIDISQTDIQRKHGGSDIDDLAKRKKQPKSNLASQQIPGCKRRRHRCRMKRERNRQSEDEKKEDEEDESEDGGIIDSEVNEEADDLESDDDDGMLSASRLRTRDDRAAENGHVPAVKNEIFRDEKAQRRTDERVFGASKRMKLEAVVKLARPMEKAIRLKKDKKKTKKGEKKMKTKTVRLKSS